MLNSQDLIDAEGEVRELTAEDMTFFRPAAEVLPGSLMTKLRVWQMRVDAAHNDSLKAHEPVASECGC